MATSNKFDGDPYFIWSTKGKGYEGKEIIALNKFTLSRNLWPDHHIRINIKDENP